ncbi:MAG: type IVB secretion system protein IcmV [Gammaproteobacteria bacterium]|nr:type IVB secretion system protein IcmV [Gammaproteobacteria bacterium]MCH9716015.1 type IVB secretion system protein IcmV [Gammaproteobacteria bacterium]MCH9763576.1 type IVB secretion system protein IcmV [Gammaproteobacteria bacterium]
MPKKTDPGLATKFSRIFPFRFWSDADRLQGFSAYIVSIFKKMFVPQPKKASESFKAAQGRLNLTDGQILEQQRALFRMSILMLLIAVGLFWYGIYQVFYGSMIGLLLTCSVILITLTLAARYHFWYFQIKVKKLGCSWKTWLHEGLLGGRKV